MHRFSPDLFKVAAAMTPLAALCSSALILALRPLLVRYALARPNARSLHRVPTPQGGGIAVLGAAIVGAAAGGFFLAFGGVTWGRLGLVLAAAVSMAAIGLVDDVRPLPPLPRLGLQLALMAVAVAALPEGARVLPFLPLWLERIVLVVGGAWFVNLVNFMDGMDLMTVTETVPVTAVLVAFWTFGALSAPAGLIALGLLGGLIGFAPFNRPVARLFLGDVGSLPIGLLLGFCLFDLAAHGGLAAAILLPLYYIADSGITLLWRLRRGERVWEAHRQHFYQVAVTRGFSVGQVLRRVVTTNLALATLAAASLVWNGAGGLAATSALGIVVVAWLLRDLAGGRAGTGS